MNSRTGHLVKMANQIALNFGAQRDPDAAAVKTAEHIEKFWTHAMREQLTGYLAGGAGDVSPVVRSALVRRASTGELQE